MELEDLPSEIKTEDLVEAVKLGLWAFIALNDKKNTSEKYFAIYFGALKTYLDMPHTEDEEEDEIAILDLDTMRCILAFPALEGLSRDPKLDPSMQTCVHDFYPKISVQNYKTQSIQDLLNDTDLTPAVQSVIGALAMIGLHKGVDWNEVTLPSLHTQIISALKLKTPENRAQARSTHTPRKPRPN